MVESSREVSYEYTNTECTVTYDVKECNCVKTIEYIHGIYCCCHNNMLSWSTDAMQVAPYLCDIIDSLLTKFALRYSIFSFSSGDLRLG